MWSPCLASHWVIPTLPLSGGTAKAGSERQAAGGPDGSKPDGSKSVHPGPQGGLPCPDHGSLHVLKAPLHFPGCQCANANYTSLAN